MPPLMTVHILFCFAVSLVIYLMNNVIPSHHVIFQYPLLQYSLIWICLYILGLPVVIYQKRYQQEHAARVKEDQGHKAGILATLNQLLQEAHPEIAYHSDRVAHLCRSLCNEMKISENQRRVIVFAAMFHNIGRIFDPLNTMARHDPARRDRPPSGECALRSVEILKHVSDYPGADLIIKHICEFWNGKGVPEGLSGVEIPLGSRVIAVADFYDQLTHGLNTDQPLNKEAAFAEIMHLKSSRFDPAVVDALGKALVLQT